MSNSSGLILIPPHNELPTGDSIFWAGPIKGASRWQDRAIELTKELAPNVNQFSPRRSVDRGKDYTNVMYNEQIAWETEHLILAAGLGVVVFYLAKEETHYCERPFARTTRFECGRFFAYHELLGIKMVIGIEEGFDKGPGDPRDGADYIREILKNHPDVPICYDLEDTVRSAIALLPLPLAEHRISTVTEARKSIG